MAASEKFWPKGLYFCHVWGGHWSDIFWFEASLHHFPGTLPKMFWATVPFSKHHSRLEAKLARQVKPNNFLDYLIVVKARWSSWLRRCARLYQCEMFVQRRNDAYAFEWPNQEPASLSKRPSYTAWLKHFKRCVSIPCPRLSLLALRSWCLS